VEAGRGGVIGGSAETARVRGSLRQSEGDTARLGWTGGRPYLVGRDLDCDVLLDLDLGVSRRHAQVSFEDGGWCLTDLGSKNGTQIGGIPISGRTRLSDGVRMRVGRTDLRFELLD